jgi:tRNA threonylcarbamoyladenosine biosynthesis protein TsaE
MVYITKSPEETEAVGRELASALDTKGIKRAFIAMRGELGVGKTAFTRGFAGYFGINGVKSPTYTIVNEYRGKVSVFHFDMYRITNEDDLYSIGFYDYAARRGISLIEWSENIPFALPERYIRLTITKNDAENPDSRKITITLAEG